MPTFLTIANKGRISINNGKSINNFSENGCYFALSNVHKLGDKNPKTNSDIIQYARIYALIPQLIDN